MALEGIGVCVVELVTCHWSLVICEKLVRVFTVSDIHIDYDENRRWLHSLSQSDYQADVLILAGPQMLLVIRTKAGPEKNCCGWPKITVPEKRVFSFP